MYLKNQSEKYTAETNLLEKVILGKNIRKNIHSDKNPI